KSIFSVGFLSNKYLLGAVLLGFILQVLVLYIPFMREAFKLQWLGAEDWLMVLALGILPLLIDEVLKIFRRRAAKKNRPIPATD
ncbi:MAG TPA: cation transporting ATPase C-terminal domain-containing protein, partial [Candidatus Sphingobacterium stercorigallinarum]|nr:cation transporting ATPase C-terminal domain-containing protein [Candidatus Sphingobacterium stercorigallinarum]